MATTYLVLSNRVLRELNEVEMTSSNFSSSRGIQTAVKDFVNKSIHDIYNEGAELPLLHTSTTQATFTGDGEYAFPTDIRLKIYSTHIRWKCVFTVTSKSSLSR